MPYVSPQRAKLAKVDVPEVVGVDGAGNAIFNGYVFAFIYISAEEPVPEIEQVTIIGVNV